VRIAARVDSNQASIVKALRQVGAKVQPTHTLGKGVPDLLVAFRGNWFVLEVKDGEKVPSKQALTEDEIRWHEEFGQQAPVFVCNSVESALRTIGAQST